MKVTLLFAMFFISIFSYAQSTPTVVYDIIYMKDGRVLYGEILQFELKDGDITFKDKYGRMYSITRKEYNYFVEDQAMKQKQRDTVVYARKFNEMEYELGLSGSLVSFSHQLTPDHYFLSSNWNGGFWFIPLSLHASVGKYFQRTFYAGVETDLGVLSSAKPMIQVGLKGRYYYDNHQSNTAKYVTLSVQNQSVGTTIEYQVADTTFDANNGGYTFPTTVETPIRLNGFRIGIGHGFQFQLENAKSIGLEFSVYKQLNIQTTRISINDHIPVTQWSAMGARILLSFRL
jgi:hypothetical protein